MIKALSTKTDNLSLVSGTGMMEGENNYHMTSMSILRHVQIQIHTRETERIKTSISCLSVVKMLVVHCLIK